MAQTIPQMFVEKVKEQPEVVVQLSKDDRGVFQPTTYAGLLDTISAFAAGLHGLGVVRGDRVGLISDNRKEWLAADLAILGIGAADVPRGCDATLQEVSYILSWSECALAVLENEKQLQKILELKSSLPLLKTLVFFDFPGPEMVAEALAQGFESHSFAGVTEMGKKA